MHLGLTGRVVLIPGAGSGIGLATAAAFVAEGAQVVAADLDPHRVSELAGSHRPDVTELDARATGALEDWVEQAFGRFGRIDVLINNLGVAPIREGFLTTSDDQWQELFALNVGSMIRASRSAIPHMIETGGGSIVTVASDAARQPAPFFVDYAATKAMLVSISKSLSIEFGPQRIRANCVAPGPTRTPPVERMLEHLAAEADSDFDTALRDYVARRGLALGQLNQPEDVARVIVFLASDAAAQVTGSVYPVDAGITRAL